MNKIKTVALAGNPNVGKSSLFNLLTGLKQHTGNWTGKTVDTAEGICKQGFKIVDLPGTYSLLSHSPEEEIASEYITKDRADLYCVICDSACLERNLPLVLQILEITDNVIVVLNLWDEAKKYQINVDINKLSMRLGVPCVCTACNSKQGITELVELFDKGVDCKGISFRYDEKIEQALTLIDNRHTKFEKLRIISSDAICENEFSEAYEYLWGFGYYPEKCEEIIAQRISELSKEIAGETVEQNNNRIERTRRIDKIVTGKYTAIPIMILMLVAVLYITIVGANYPSQLLSLLFGKAEQLLNEALLTIGISDFIRELLVFGVWRVLSWVVAVMLPPMAIFFPLFTLLEDSGFLPRIAFNMDTAFCKCKGCGKQSLTMCMGLGCNAVGVAGARIIDSPRERLIAIMTNVFAPCNGRFPMLITLVTVFFGSYLAAPLVCCVIVFGIILTLVVSRFLSLTILKGIPSAFTLELPPYRLPRVGDVIVRSFIDRTLFVLSRAVAVAAPSGAVIWLMSNVCIDEVSILTRASDLLEPFALLFGLDGVILLAFILGAPANEIVLPLILMGYSGTTALSEVNGVGEIWNILNSNGWSMLTCVNVIIFTLCHFPCTTTLLTIKKETSELKWTVLSALIPTVVGLTLCFLSNSIFGC